MKKLLLLLLLVLLPAFTFAKQTFVQDIIARTNVLRVKNWVGKLTESTFLDKIATEECNWLYKHHSYKDITTHDRKGLTAQQRYTNRLSGFNSTVWGENQLRGDYTAKAATTDFWKSLPHRENLLQSTFTLIGIAQKWAGVCESFSGPLVKKTEIYLWNVN